LRLAAVLPLFLALPGPAAALEPSAVLSSVRKAYTASPSFTASFVQTYVPAGFAPAAPEKGRVTMAAPDRIRFDYEGKEGKLFAFDGTAARQYVAADRQLVVRTLTSDEKQRLPLLFFESPEALLRRFTATAAPGEEGLTNLALTPRSGGEPARLDLAVAASGEVRRLAVTDLAGNRTTFTFAGLAAAGKLPHAEFAPAPPPGTKVISDGKERR
jgi:outer membrane lipoprotein-sorting protein